MLTDIIFYTHVYKLQLHEVEARLYRNNYTKNDTTILGIIHILLWPI